MRVQIRNEGAQSIPFNITDRPTEVQTAMISSSPDTVPPLSTLSFHLQEGDVIVIQSDGGITIEKEKNNGS